MSKIINWYQNINIDALFEMYGNPVQYVIKTGLKNLQGYLKNQDITPKEDIKTLKYIYNICDHVLYEDDEIIKKLWANLLLNAIDSKSDKHMKNIYINILANIDSSSAQLFEQLVNFYDLMKRDMPYEKPSLGLSSFKEDLEGESGAILRSTALI